MSTRNLDKIFQPHRIVLLGADDEPFSPGSIVLRNIFSGNFPGVVYPVDPRREAVHGIATFPDLRSLPHAADLALLCGPAADVPDQLRQCARAGIEGAIIYSEGFRESGPVGAALETQIRKITSEFTNLRVLGPNTLGIVAPHAGLNASQAITKPPAGHLAFISQSRALCNSIIDWATEQGIGFSYFVSIGNMVDIGFGDLIDYLNRDPHTRAIILYLQSIEHARSFMSAARAFARMKPIVAYKAGRFSASAKAAASHTGAMVAEDAVYGAALERAGVMRVTDLDDVFDVAELLTSKRLPKGPKLAIVSNAGGPAVIATDSLLAREGVLARLNDETIAALNAALPSGGGHNNPADLLDSATADDFSEAIKIVLEDECVDAVLVIFAAQAGSDSLHIAKKVAGIAEHSNKPVLAAWMGGRTVRPGIQHLNEAGIATHSTPEQAVRAFMHLVSYARNLESLYQTPRELPVRFDLNRHKLRRKLRPLFRGKTSRFVSQEQAKSLLKAYGIPFVDGAIVGSREAAIHAAEQIGYPVVLKILAPQIVHKVDIGGVALDLADANAVAEAFGRISQCVREQGTQLDIQGIAVQKMIAARDGIELILGARKDPTFGPVLMVGSGGVATDVTRDRALGLPPLNERLTRRMLEALRLWPILQGYRGRPAIDLDRLIEVVIRFSCLISDYPEIREFEINPLIATPRGVVGVDAAAILEEATVEDARDPYAHLAIRPYPEEYVRHDRLKDGTPVILRFVRPEDEHQWHRLIAASSPESIRFRFRSLFKKSTHKMAVEQCFIDYEREIGLVAEVEADDSSSLIGVAHLLTDATRDSAEFAVIIADAWQRKGLGGLLLDYCLELAGRWGFKRIIAETHPENRPMLAVFDSRGFAANIRREDDVVYLEKRLSGRRKR
ncbi:MAG TPA: GNAT family N-acetyltransferase [Kiloniellales bacterium]